MLIKAGLPILFIYRTLPHGLADEPDYWPSSSSSNPSDAGSSTNVGAIIGGVIGGTAGLLLILIGGYFLSKRRRLWNNETSIAHKGAPVTNTHAHQPSDPFTFPQTPTNPSPPTSHMTSPPHGIGSAPNTLVPTPYSSFRVSTPPPAETAPFLTTAAQRIRPIPMI